MFSKTEDGEIDCILRAHAGRRGEHGFICREFDPDYASAFVEQSLTPGEQSRYEDHLAACHPCRSSVIALARLADADADRSRAELEPAPALDERARSARGGLGAWLGGWLGPVSVRHLVPAAVAFLIVAVSLPLLLLRKDSRPETARAGVATTQEQSAGGQTKDGAGLASSKPDEKTEIARAEPAKASEPAASNRPQPATEAPAKESDGAALTDQPAPAAPPKMEQVASAPIAEETSRDVAGSVQRPSQPSEPAPAPEAAETKLARIDETSSLRVPGDSKGSAEMIVVKPGVYSGSQSSGRITTGTITPKDAIAPISSSSADAMRRGLARGNPEAESRARNSSEAARLRGTATRKIGSKTFWLVKGVWTDKKYNSGREQAEITVVRDSDIYSDLMAKHGGLKVFFTAFPSDERVTVVYKDTVYKLVPPAK
ncbi:MAG TPA: hypothetical protein VNH22_06100 [Blastocatellia bacterium]|nr:hypothetical protein [Blastocatellia bacterium]